MRNKYIVSVFIFLLIFSIIPNLAFASKRIALVIGNKDYKVGALKNPVNDANAVARVLRACNFEVILKTNADHRTMESAIRDFGKRLEKSSTGLFYYAGHGMQVDGVNYLIPIGAQIESNADVKFETVNAGLVLAKMKDARNALNIIILDACRNNPFRSFFRSLTPGLARMSPPPGSLIAYATAPGKVAYDGGGKNSAYTKHLVLNMQKPGLIIEEILKNVRIAVLAETSGKQIPWESSSLTGNFYFFPAKNKNTPAPSLPAAKTILIPDKKVSDIDALLAQAEAKKQREEEVKSKKQKEFEQKRQRLIRRCLLLQNRRSKRLKQRH